MTLGELFAGIANAIRSKDGTTDRIPALTFPERIMAISGGGGGGGPFCTMSLTVGDNNIVEIDTGGISVDVLVTTEEYRDPASYTHALYNGVRLPILPSADASQYEYFWIRKDTKNGYYDLLCGNLQPWYSPSDPGIRYGTSTGFVKWYQIAISTAETATAWAIKSSTDTWFGVDDNRSVLWSNHDIPNGSASSINIYFEGTAPVLTD